MDPTARRVAQRFIVEAGRYSDDLDPSELWDELVAAFPRSMQELFDRPAKSNYTPRKWGEDRLTYSVEFDLGDNLNFDPGGTLSVYVSASAYTWEEADDEGRYGGSGVEGEYELIAGSKKWTGETKPYHDQLAQELNHKGNPKSWYKSCSSIVPVEHMTVKDAIADALTALVAPDGLVPSEETTQGFMHHLLSLGFTVIPLHDPELLRRAVEELDDAALVYQRDAEVSLEPAQWEKLAKECTDAANWLRAVLNALPRECEPFHKA